MLNIVWATLTWGNNSISPMITSMKSTHGSVPFKHNVVRLYIAALLNMVQAVLTWGNNQWPASIMNAIRLLDNHYMSYSQPVNEPRILRKGSTHTD